MLKDLLKESKSILCLNGDLPDKNFFPKNIKIVAADGAANKLLAMNVHPHVIIGDLDSYNHSGENIPVLHIPDQNQSDFQKSFTFLSENNLLPTLVCGVSGGFIDHILNNISLVSQYNCAFYCPPIIGYVISERNSTNFTLTKGTKVSLIGLPTAKVSTRGFKWELSEFELNFCGTNSCFNRIETSNCSIKVFEGKALVFIYLEHIEDSGL